MRLCGLGHVREVATSRVVGKSGERDGIAMGSGPFERAHADVAGGDAGEHRAWQHAFPVHGFARGNHRKASRRGNAERVHRLADDVLAEHGTKRGAAIAAT